MDLQVIFIGDWRVVEMLARFAIGFPLPAVRGQGKIAGHNCWAEFCTKGIGWAPIDASEAAKNPAKREYFLGAHDENRLEFLRGPGPGVDAAAEGRAAELFQSSIRGSGRRGISGGGGRM